MFDLDGSVVFEHFEVDHIEFLCIHGFGLLNLDIFEVPVSVVFGKWDPCLAFLKLIYV